MEHKDTKTQSFLGPLIFLLNTEAQRHGGFYFRSWE